jgi:hypothetical protein
MAPGPDSGTVAEQRNVHSSGHAPDSVSPDTQFPSDFCGTDSTRLESFMILCIDHLGVVTGSSADAPGMRLVPSSAGTT